MSRDVNVTKRVKTPKVSATAQSYFPPMVAFGRTGFWSMAQKSGIRRVLIISSGERARKEPGSQLGTTQPRRRRAVFKGS
jgi:hypothetical protein